MWGIKNLVGLLAVAVTVSSAAHRPKFAGQKSSLLSDLFEFIAVIPYDEVEDIIIEKADNDPNVKATLEYFRTEDFQNQIDAMSELSEFESVLDYLEDADAPAHQLWDLFRMIMGLDPVMNKHRKFGTLPIGPIPTGPTLEMMDEILAAIDPKEIKDVYDQKIKESEDFNNLVDSVKNEKFDSLAVALKESAKFKKVLNQLKFYGFDLLGVLDTVVKFFLDAIQLKF